jgi:hypothetical protein
MVNIRPLNESLQKKAIKELSEDPDRIEKDFETFREWIKKSQHIKSRDHDDQLLVNFLRACKFSLEKTKQKYDLFFTLKTHVPELMKNRDPTSEKVLSAMRQGYRIPLPNVESPDGPKYFLFRIGCHDPSKFWIPDIIKTTMMIIELMLRDDDNFAVAGCVYIFDLNGVSLSHLLQLDPVFFKKCFMLMQDALPIRQKALHFFNMDSMSIKFLNFFITFLNEKLKKRVRKVM